MTEQDFVQLMCQHKLQRDEREQCYRCRCGLTITDKDLVQIPKRHFKSLTTWMAYHFEQSSDP